jgi:MFS family permease
LLYSLESLSASSSGDLLDLSALALSIGLLICFAVYAKGRAGAARIDLRLFRNATFAAAAVTQFLSNAVSIGGQMLLPLYLLSVPKISPAETGLLLAPAGLGMLCSYPSMGPLTERYGVRRISATGACVALVELFLLPGLAPLICQDGRYARLFFVRGVGLGAISIPSIAAAYSSISKEAIPVATTAINIVQRLGGPVATTVLATYLHDRMTLESHHDALAQSASLARAFAATFWLLCLINVAVVVAALERCAGKDREVRWQRLGYKRKHISYLRKPTVLKAF